MDLWQSSVQGSAPLTVEPSVEASGPRAIMETAWAMWRRRAPLCAICADHGRRSRVYRFINMDAERCRWGHTMTGIELYRRRRAQTA